MSHFNIYVYSLYHKEYSFKGRGNQYMLIMARFCTVNSVTSYQLSNMGLTGLEPPTSALAQLLAQMLRLVGSGTSFCKQMLKYGSHNFYTTSKF